MTTGDRKLDQAIARFIYDPRTLRCDERNDWPDYWARGGTDGRPPLPPWTGFESTHKGAPTDETFTRAEIMESRK